MEIRKNTIDFIDEELDRSYRSIEDCITDIRILEENEKITRELIELLKETDMKLLTAIEEQKDYIIERNRTQTERIFNIYKMLVIVAIALLILFIVVILK